jgi:hypothetical protein
MRIEIPATLTVSVEANWKDGPTIGYNGPQWGVESFYIVLKFGDFEMISWPIPAEDSPIVEQYYNDGQDDDGESYVHEFVAAKLTKAWFPANEKAREDIDV